MRYEVIVDISQKNGKPYGYIDLGYRREFVSLQVLSELLQVPYVNLLVSKKTIVGKLDITRTNDLRKENE